MEERTKQGDLLIAERDQEGNHITITRYTTELNPDLSNMQNMQDEIPLISSKKHLLNAVYEKQQQQKKQKESEQQQRSNQQLVQQPETSQESQCKIEQAQKCIAMLMKKVRQGVLVKDFESPFRFALAIISGIFFLFAKAGYSFRQWSQDQQPAIEIIELQYLFFSVFMIGLLSLTKQVIKQIFYQWVMQNLSSKYKGIQRHHRVNKIILWVFETIYYFHMTIFGLFAFHNASWMPVELGGNGSCNNLLSSFPNLDQEDTYLKKQMIYFNLIQLAFHTSALVELFFGARKVDEQKKYETGLNHFMFFAIIVYSLLFNLLNISTVFFILHNIGDIIVSGGRAYADLEQKQKHIVYLLITFGVSIWIATRFFIVPKCIIFQFLGITNLAQNFWSIFKYAYIYLLILFVATIFLEIYWTLFLVQVSVSYLLNPHFKNIYDNRDFKKLYQYIKSRNS